MRRTSGEKRLPECSGGTCIRGAPELRVINREPAAGFGNREETYRRFHVSGGLINGISQSSGMALAGCLVL